MGDPTAEVGYTSATARRGEHEISYEHVVALGKKNAIFCITDYCTKNTWFEHQDLPCQGSGGGS